MGEGAEPAVAMSVHDKIFVRFAYLSGTLRILLFLAPSLAYMVTSKWDVVFRDCFSPIELMLDQASILVTFWLYLFGPENTKLNIVIMCFGLCFTAMSLAMYCLFMTFKGGNVFDRFNAKKYWYYCVMGFMVTTCFLTLMGLCMKDNMEVIQDGQLITPSLRRLWLVAPVAEAMKVLYPALLRLLHHFGISKSYTGEGRKVRNVKLVQSVVTSFLMGWEFADLHIGEFSSSDTVYKLKVISLVAGLGAVLQFIVRLFEPHTKQREVIEVAQGATEEQMEEMLRAVRGNIRPGAPQRAYQALRGWLGMGP